MSYTSLDAEVSIDFVIDLAKKAGTMIKDKVFNRDKAIKSKASLGDLVTETDVAVENALMSIIKERYPDHQFVCEESATTGQRCTDAPTWIIDPIDGTTNFVHTFPFCCVSIGFCRNKIPVIGVVYNPLLDELFVGQKGGGAFLNGVSIKTSGVTELGQSLVSTGFGMNITRALGDPNASEEKKKIAQHRKNEILKYTGKLMETVHDIRRVGSAALDICHVAMGRQDVFFEIGPCEWDIAAGLCILREAGGVDGDFNKEQPLELHLRRVVVAATQELYDEIVEVILKDVDLSL
eukprot:GDKJ01000145.1.p1 GENE.GDKJ01000145.1~~GDKJ01000145.1.p1  ORF type:complete len:293 (+),score=86.40 GDKJ01000145.1:29-907(+)